MSVGLIQRYKIRFAEWVYNQACKHPFTIWSLPGLYELSIWAEETLREYRMEKKKQKYRKIREEFGGTY